jgi:predicted heme/steroid binding protein
MWLWRADHDASGDVNELRNKVNTSLQINGDDVTAYGTMCEHTLGNMLEWNGQNGRNYFFQSEYPYDVDKSYNDQGFAAYRVGDNVTSHEAWGTGAYTYFRVHNDVYMDSGIKAPKTEGVKFHNSFGRFLAGNGGQRHIIDDDGEVVDNTTYMKYVCEWDGGKNVTYPA